MATAQDCPWRPSERAEGGRRGTRCRWRSWRGQVTTSQDGCAWSAVGSTDLTEHNTGFRGLSLDPAPDPTWAAPGRPAGEETGASGAQASGTVSTREHGIACPVPSASSLRALQGTDTLGNAALTSPLRHRQPRSSLGAGGQAEVTETLPGSLLSLPQKYSYISDPKRSFL